MGDSDLHRKLLFGRDGVAVRPFNKFALQSGWLGEDRISLRDGGIRPTSESAIAILGDFWRMRESLEHPFQPSIRLSFLCSNLRFQSDSVSRPFASPSLRPSPGAAQGLTRRRGEGGDGVPLLSLSEGFSQAVRPAPTAQFDRDTTSQRPMPHFDSQLSH